MRWIHRCLVLVAIVILFWMAASPDVTVPRHNLGELRLLAIGVDKYGKTQYRYSKNDARSIASVFQRHWEGVFSGVEDKTLLDENATIASITSVFEKIGEETRPDDTFVFFFAGASSVTVGNSKSPPTFRLLTFDPHFDEQSYDHDDRQGISADQLEVWLSKIPAHAQLVVLDTNDSDRAFELLRARLQKTYSPTGFSAYSSDHSVLLVGMKGVEYEQSEGEHALLAQAVINGLSGEADIVPKDGIVTARELEAFLYSEVLKSQEALPEAIRISTFFMGPDFQLATMCVRVSPIPARGFSSVSESPQKLAVGTGERKDYALLFATDDYEYKTKWKHLSNPIWDAQELARELHDYYGFHVDMRKNATKTEIATALSSYREVVYGPEDQLLIFFAGHGTYDDVLKVGYLVPSDAKPDDPLRDSYLSHPILQRYVSSIPARHTLLVMDVCFGGTFDQRLTTNGMRGEDDSYSRLPLADLISRKSSLKTQKYLMSGGKAYVPDGRPGHHSPFAAALIGKLEHYGDKRGYYTFESLVDAVETLDPQPVWGEISNNDDVGSEFFLVSKELIVNLASSAPLQSLGEHSREKMPREVNKVVTPQKNCTAVVHKSDPITKLPYEFSQPFNVNEQQYLRYNEPSPVGYGTKWVVTYKVPPEGIDTHVEKGEAVITSAYCEKKGEFLDVSVTKEPRIALPEAVGKSQLTCQGGKNGSNGAIRVFGTYEVVAHPCKNTRKSATE
jgi:uncharacterized caspase-like protein